MKIRLEGTEKEIQQAIETIKRSFNVLQISDLYKNRVNSKLYRIYIEFAINTPENNNAKQ